MACEEQWRGLERQRDELQEQFPGWQAWFTPRVEGGPAWYARPWPLPDCGSPEDLAAAVKAAHAGLADQTQAIASYRNRTRLIRERAEAARLQLEAARAA